MTTYLHQFSGSEAGETLAHILHRMDNKYLTAKVARVISQHNEFVKDVDKMENSVNRARAAKMIKHHVLTQQWPTIPAECQTFMRNIMIAKVRDILVRG